MKTGYNWPLASNYIRRGSVSNTFGMVRRNQDGSQRPHQGWDFFAPVGTPVYAVADGVVSFADARSDYGNIAIVQHSDGNYTAYAHLSAFSVRAGQAVKCGDRLGAAGCSGNAAGMTGDDQHLHFEVRTVPFPGLGLDGRKTPLELFGVCPMGTAVVKQ
jgi:murein DD-endopeptidase MepM/ murein hydrolase activator NlpD